MYYYEIIIDKEIIGVCTSYNMVRYQAKHRVLLGTSENYAEFANLDGELYHASWMQPVGEDCPLEYKDASVLLIDEAEYDQLHDELVQNGMITLPEEVEEIIEVEETVEVTDEETGETVEETVTVAKSALALRIEALEAQNELLTECVLELSALLYGGEG